MRKKIINRTSSRNDIDDRIKLVRDIKSAIITICHIFGKVEESVSMIRGM